mgnify:CR=1 FL=1
MDDREQYYKEFYAALVTAVEPSGGHLHEVNVSKNNTTLKGIVIKFDNVDVAPTVYPDFYYSDWKSGHPMGDIISGIRTELMRTAPTMGKFNMNDLSRENAPLHLYAAVVNYENNKAWLKDIPHERVADLAVFAKWKFDGADPDAVMAAKVTAPLLAHLQLTKEEALKIAKTNTARNARFEGMDVIMSGILLDEGMDKELAEAMTTEYEAAPFHVLTNESGIDGAAAIACPEVLKAIHKQIGEDFYILPSSIHETLILPKTGIDDVEGLKQMVSSINEQEVAPEEQLSNSVYEFDGHSLKIAGSEITQEHNLADSITHHRSR